MGRTGTVSVLFTDIVGSTETAAELGDGAWRSLLQRHDALVREEVERQRGRFVKSLGDGALAVFDGPSRAISSATPIRDWSVYSRVTVMAPDGCCLPAFAD